MPYFPDRILSHFTGRIAVRCVLLMGCCASGSVFAQDAGAGSDTDLPELFSGPLFHETGTAHVLEGDHLVVNDTVMSLYGVEAPLRIQPCTRDGETFACGVEASQTLVDLIEGETVTCDQVRDPSLRRRALTFARCTLGGMDVAAEMVRHGMAMAFPEQSDEYVELEADARAGEIGLWSADRFEKPWVWEARQKMR